MKAIEAGILTETTRSACLSWRISRTSFVAKSPCGSRYCPYQP